MSNNQSEQFIAKSIKSKYQPAPANTDVEKLQKLDEKVTKAPMILALCLGIIATLVFGTGMCLVLGVLGDYFAVGIIVGVVGMAIIIANYPVYRAWVKRNKKKYSPEIIALSDSILNK